MFIKYIQLIIFKLRIIHINLQITTIIYYQFRVYLITSTVWGQPRAHGSRIGQTHSYFYI